MEERPVVEFPSAACGLSVSQRILESRINDMRFDLCQPKSVMSWFSEEFLDERFASSFCTISRLDLDPGTFETLFRWHVLVKGKGKHGVGNWQKRGFCLE